MVSIMDEALELEVGNKVLEIGGGSGWHAVRGEGGHPPGGHRRGQWEVSLLGGGYRASQQQEAGLCIRRGARDRGQGAELLQG